MTIAKSCLEAAEVSCPRALPNDCGTYCDFNLNIGIFFDGTDNNKDRDTPTKSHSNIARLSDAYKDYWEEGFFSHYIEGVGTPALEKFGTDGESVLEAAAGKGGEPRIIYGLLQVLNSVHRFVNKNEAMFNPAQMKVLCSNHWVTPEKQNEWPKPIPSEEDQILEDLNLHCGLVADEKVRNDFLKVSAGKLSGQLRSKTVMGVAGIYLDIFGFSRGAAQARVFTNWLHKYFFMEKKLFGVPSYVRMLGLMDTVSSVGLPNAILGEGHWDWATPKNLHIHPDVKNCVHYVALHELRTVFPCDSISRNNGLPDNCHEHYYPGAHSDVGGGYAPGFQGKGVTSTGNDASGNPLGIADDSQKLSQLPLNDMYQAAKKACQFHSLGQPWLEVAAQSETDTNPLIQEFALDPKVRTSVETYLANCKIPQNLPIDQQLREHGLLYLTWRYLITHYDKFDRLYSVHYAQKLDEDSLSYYRHGQAIFSAQVSEAAKNASILGTVIEMILGKPTRLRFGRHAKEIYKRISKKNTILGPGIVPFFDHMVHDSYAAFIKKLDTEILRDAMEGEGYLRYRGVYLGSDESLNAMAEAPEQTLA